MPDFCRDDAIVRCPRNVVLTYQGWRQRDGQVFLSRFEEILQQRLAIDDDPIGTALAVYDVRSQVIHRLSSLRIEEQRWAERARRQRYREARKMGKTRRQQWRHVGD